MTLNSKDIDLEVKEAVIEDLAIAEDSSIESSISDVVASGDSVSNDFSSSPMVPNSILFNKVGISPDELNARQNSQGDENLDINYKNIPLLMNYLADSWRILPRRLTKLSKKQQKQLKKSIKQARQLMLLPYKPVNDI